VRERIKDRWREAFGWAAIALGALAAMLGWVGVSGKDLAPLQLPYLASGGVFGLLFTIVGVGLLVAADVRRDRDRLARIEGDIVELQELLREALESSKGRGGRRSA
jgi:protein-S-isoprenylcysteine O-methyltransferase Ste14